jgi:tetratricopeptide (TPR) repeat protein
VGLDESYAPAWSALGKRYYYEEEYGPGATGTMEHTTPALRRALSLDPNLEDAEQQIVSLDTDAGKLGEAYREAKAMVDAHPQSGFAHFTLSYVLRYGGMNNEAAVECETALRLDPGNYQFRSCSAVFFATGQYDRALTFIKLDEGSEWSNNVEAMMLLQQGKTAEALEKLRKLPDSQFFHTRAIEACYSNPRPAGSEQALEQARKDIEAYHDPEPRFSQAMVLNRCLGNEFTAKGIKAAIVGGFCGYDQLQHTGLLEGFRKSADYAPLLAAAKQCRDTFLAERGK